MAFGNATKGYVKSHGGGGGGGGTRDYNNLSNKPQVNGRVLEGNVSIPTITELLEQPITATGSTGIDVSNYQYLQFVFGVEADGRRQYFAKYIPTDILNNNWVFLAECASYNTQYIFNLSLSANNNILNVEALNSGWNETATIFSIKGIKF